MQKLFILLFFYAFTYIASAQERITFKEQKITDDEINKIKGELAPQELEDFDAEAKRKVEEFLRYHQILPDKKKSLVERKNALILAEKLFDNPKERLIEVSSLNRTSKKRYTIHDYLISLMDGFGYEKVKITYFDVVRLNRVDNFNDMVFMVRLGNIAVEQQ